ncbi:MAG: HAMP domain-containing histidine kinase [Rubrivivax sp.]|nr:HAMP domain-containing histidine kinase [Rubrivivax sp.]
MSVRLRLALTVLLTGLATAVGVLVAMALAFERFEREAAYARADAFLGRVVALHEDLPAYQRRDPEAFTTFLKSLLLFEADSQLYLLAPDGTVLASTGSKPLAPEFKVAIGPVRQAAAVAAAPPGSAPAGGPQRGAAYVMGDDPEYMDEGAVIAARALTQPSIAPGADLAGYLYLVCRKPGLPPTRLARLAGHLAGPALGPVLVVVLLATALAAWIIAAVTRPLAVLSDEVASAARAGFAPGAPSAALAARPAADDEFGRLHAGFQMLLTKLHAQWDQLRRLDAFRRESVSNLSHDLRSPLTAAAASLETLQQRPALAADAEATRLVDLALRNTHNAARMVRSLGDLAVLDETSFRLRLARLDLAEVLDDIAMRFAERAARQGVAIRCEFGDADDGAMAAEVDVELIERAVANLLDNSLRHTPAGGRIVLSAHRQPAAGSPAGVPAGNGAETLRLTVQDTGSGIDPADLARLFDRHFSGGGHRPGHGGNGLGLAIVQRIVELHGGRVQVASTPGAGTAVTLELPARPPEADASAG